MIYECSDVIDLEFDYEDGYRCDVAVWPAGAGCYVHSGCSGHHNDEDEQTARVYFDGMKTLDVYNHDGDPLEIEPVTRGALLQECQRQAESLQEYERS